MTARPPVKGLDGRCALITGGASGIGLAMTRTFAERGTRVVVLDQDPHAEAAVRDLENAAVAFGNVTEPADVKAAFDLAERRFGPVDIVLANAGISQNCPTLDLDFEGWRRVMSVNLDGVFLTVHEAGRRMVPLGRGSIVLTSSIYGVVAAPERLGYVVSKSGVSAMAKALAVEWARHGIRVNAIAPGYVRTPFLEDLQARGRLDLGALERRTPMGRLIETHEVAEVAAFLASDASGPMTGQVVGVDGGWTAYGYI
ncbi:SDR family NAD(P)-dependent oxidoreductase [Microvirga makkahensis]|uniref:SDR family oxidoreductase n=1 Tax=Microvirga makkahensis TaxID=1128670 RepID=A0A7X3SMT9_9HYPH|nr:SDR family NAD(P)-dependent oxidoreductase [Microvirga makkahensis]MXQ10595.1 SDR family oxidoreductase [Microvirga makkahensis]